MTACAIAGLRHSRCPESSWSHYVKLNDAHDIPQSIIRPGPQLFAAVWQMLLAIIWISGYSNI
jgi:hypothetical protein